MLQPRMAAIVSMIFAAAASRLLPHPPNLTAMTAMALFAGASLSDWRLALAVPLTALLLSDALIGFYSHMEIVYASFALVVGVGLLVRSRRSVPMIGAAALSSSVLFFVLTNFGVWATESMYPKTGAGLIACYVAAIPFFRNMLVGDLFYTVALFGGLALLEKSIPSLRARQAVPSPA